MSRSLVTLITISVTALLALVSPAVSFGDPASDLAEAEADHSAATAMVSAAERDVEEAEASLAPAAERAEKADAALADAEAEAERLTETLVAERQAAATQIEIAKSNYDDEEASHDTTTAVGIGIAVAAILLSGATLAFSRFRQWPLSKRLTQVMAAVLGLAFVSGVALAVAPSAPSSPEFPQETLELAAAAKGDPADPASPEIIKAEAEIEPLAKKAQPLDRAGERAESQLENAESAAESAKAELSHVTRQVNVAQKEVDHLEAIANEEAEFREEATTIDYKQLIKDPDAYKGEKVVYTGQVFQIQESGGSGFMLLSVTDEGYGFWTDNIWVEFEEGTEAAEEDIVTIYGKLTGSEEYETQIGGSTYVPRMNAKYIDE